MKHSLVVAGLNVEVYSANDIRASKLPIAVLFFLHGRGGSTASLERGANTIINLVEDKRKEYSKASEELIVVTFDHRNHGTRLVSPLANNAWLDEDRNHNHAIDMYAIQTGTANDVSFLIDFLPAFLFPAGERSISRWLVAGISLGGHSAWITLRKEPRIHIGVPIIGCADFLGLISERAEKSGLTPTSPHIPDILRAIVRENDPIWAPYEATDSSNPFIGKKVLALSGGKDELVPWRHSEPFFNKLNVGPQGVKRAIVAPDVGHACTPEMITQLVEFIWENGLAGVDIA